MPVTEAPVLTRRPGRPKRASEFDTRSVDPTQKPSRLMPPIDEPAERESDVVIAEAPLTTAHADALLFAEEPMKIIIHQSGEKFGPKCTDLISINGRWAEMLFKNGWVQIGYLPRGMELYTKRKYVEVMAKSKKTEFTTRVVKHNGEDKDPDNYLDPVTSSSCPFSVLEDKNPRGAEWLTQILRSM